MNQTNYQDREDCEYCKNKQNHSNLDHYVSVAESDSRERASIQKKLNYVVFLTIILAILIAINS